MLFKSVIRDVKKRYFQVLLLATIIVLSSFVYVVMTYSIGSIKEPTEIYFQDFMQEDFNVTINNQILESEKSLLLGLDGENSQTLSELYTLDQVGFEAIITHRMQQFESQFDSVITEARLFKDIMVTKNDQQHTFRVLKDAKHINLSYISEGEKPASNREIALIEYYAKANDISIGDYITIDNQEFLVTGFVYFPDYSLIIFGNEFLINNKTRTLALLSDTEFQNLNSSVQIVLAGKFIEDVNPTQYFRNVELDFVLSVSLTENTVRSGAIYEELAGGEAMGILIALIIAIMAVFVVALMIHRILNDHKGAIGILKALGYKNYEVTIPYLVFILLLSLPGLLLGYYLGYLFAEPLKNMYIGIYILPNAPVMQTLEVFLTSIVAPLFVLMTLGYFVVYKLLNKHPIELMQAKIEKKQTKKRARSSVFLEKLSLITRLKHAYIIRNLVRFSLFLVGVFTATFLILMSLSMVDIFDKTINYHYSQIDMRYVGYCDPLGVCPEEEVAHDKVIEMPNVMIHERNVLVVGMDSNNSFYPLFENKHNITQKLDEDGIILTKGMALITGLKVGDRVNVSYGGIQTDLEIVGIQDEYMTDKVFINRAALSWIITQGESLNYYNAIYSNEVPLANYQNVLDIGDMIEQSKELSNLGNIMSYILIVSALFIGIIVMVLISSLSIEAYFYDISMFQVIGYTNKEIQKIFINSYQLYIAVIFVFAVVPTTLFSFDLITNYLAKQFDMIFPMSLSIIDYLIGFVLTMSIFYISVPLAKRKLSQHTLQQALMIYQV